jgi:hypothetical protein
VWLAFGVIDVICTARYGNCHANAVNVYIGLAKNSIQYMKTFNTRASYYGYTREQAGSQHPISGKFQVTHDDPRGDHHMLPRGSALQCFSGMSTIVGDMRMLSRQDPILTDPDSVLQENQAVFKEYTIAAVRGNMYYKFTFTTEVSKMLTTHVSIICSFVVFSCFCFSANSCVIALLCF